MYVKYNDILNYQNMVQCAKRQLPPDTQIPEASN